MTDIETNEQVPTPEQVLVEMRETMVPKEEAQKSRLDEMVEETFEGSMPAFIAAFSKSKRLSRDEVEQLKQLIDSYQE